MRLPPFTVFLEQHREDVYRFLRALVGPHDADDCFQETFLAALRGYGNLTDAGNLRGWVLTIAHNKALDLHRARAKAPSPVAELPERAEHAAFRDGEIWQAVGTLPPKQRAAVVHRFVGDMPYRDVAAMIGCTEEAARRSVHEGVRRLREVWEP